MSGEVKMMAPTTTLWWVDIDGTFDPDAPKAADLIADLDDQTPANTKAWNLSSAVASGYTLNPQDSDTVTSTAITDKGAGQSRGAANYEGLLPFFMEADPGANTDSVYLKAYELFKIQGRMGYVVRRLGKVSTAAPAEGDIVEIYKFLTAMPRIQPPDNNSGAFQFQVPMLKQGFLKINVSLAA